MTYPLDEHELRRMVLNRDQVATSVTVPAGLQGMDVRLTQYLADQLVVSLSGYVLSEHLADDTQTDTQRVPDRWWDHAKVDALRWADDHRGVVGRVVRWWVRNHQPRWRTVTFSVTWHRAATRPHSTLALPDSLGPVVYQERVTREWEGDR